MAIFFTDSELTASPNDFGASFIIRKLLGLESLALYAELRVRGFDALSSFAASFSNSVIGRAEDLAEAAAFLEQSPLFKNAFDQSAARLGDEQIKHELEERMRECSGMTADYALSIRSRIPAAPLDPISPSVLARDEAELKRRLDAQSTRKQLEPQANIESQAIPIQVAPESGWTIPKDTRVR